VALRRYNTIVKCKRITDRPSLDTDIIEVSPSEAESLQPALYKSQDNNLQLKNINDAASKSTTFTTNY